MRKTALLGLIRRGESPNVVFQSDTISSEVLAKELVALMNLRRGRVILWVPPGSDQAQSLSDKELRPKNDGFKGLAAHFMAEKGLLRN